MARLSNLKALALRDPLKALALRNPNYFNRYAGVDDAFGYKIETYALWEPFFRFCFEDYFKVDCRGLNNIPAAGAGLLVGNHSGLLPIDGAMIAIALSNQHPSQRRIRYMVTDWFFTLPGVSDWMVETGQVRATLDNAKALVQAGELVGVYPEGLRGVGKAFPERYRVLDFHPGFVQLAIATQTPIIPVATVGGDEIYPNFVNLKAVGRLLKMPFFPITTGFPWLPFPLMFMPLPVRWLINIHAPINLGYPPEKANDRKLVLKIAREIQYDIQRDLNKMLRERKSVFTGWAPGEQ
jgi:1-acyl-sn-glycerol-3-phosphate acyltransferase